MSGKQFAILTATVVPLVLIATFLSVGTGGRKAEEKGKTSSLPVLAEPHLTFERAIEHAGSWVVPGLVSRFNPKGPPDEEVGSEGHHDFWFKNENDAAVEVVVTHLSCSRCVTLRIALAPEDWQAAQAVQAAAAVVLGQAGALGGNLEQVAEGPVPGPNAAWATLDSQEVFKHDAKGFRVPAKRAGWVRLGWKEQTEGPQLISADVHTTCPAGDAPPIKFQVGGNFVDPVRVLPENKELSVETLVNGDAPRAVNFTVYSSTRDRFSLEPESEEVQRKEHPFAQCGRPEPLTRKECDDLQKENKRAVRCGYRVAVTVSERLKDNREHDLGPFRTGVALTSDVLDKTVGLWVRGTVRGELTVLGGEGDANRDRVNLGAFPRTIGVTRTFTIEAQADTPLVLDRAPAFMKIEELRAEPGAGRRKTWTVTLTIPPNAVSGAFPKADDPALRDTAIHLKANGRGVRIPVSGMASQ